MSDNKHLFERRHYNALADTITTVLHNTKPEHLEVACSLFLRFTTGLAMRSSNMQIGRFMDAAGIPRSTTPETTRRP
jgi:hypothetical protein